MQTPSDFFEGKKITMFKQQHYALFPLSQPDKTYPKELAVFQNIFWKLTHEKPLKDEIIKLLFFFSPLVRASSVEQLSEETSFSISARQYAELAQINLKTAYAALSRSIDLLYDHSVIFYHEASNEVIRTRLVSSCSYSEGVITVRFTHYALYIMSVFNKDNPFTKLKVKAAMPLTSYALKMYPLFVQNHYRKTFEVSIQNLKEALGIDINSYSEYKEFKRAVLKPSVDSINKLTELSVQFSVVKKLGRRASHVQFTVSNKKTVSSETVNESPTETEVAKVDDKEIFASLRKIGYAKFFKEDEVLNEFIDRVKADLATEKRQYWIDQISKFTNSSAKIK